MAVKRISFRELAARLRHRTLGRDQTPSEVLIREDRDSGHRVVSPELDWEKSCITRNYSNEESF